MTLSRPFQRLMPIVLICSLLCVTGCTSTGNLSAGRLPYNGVAARQGTQDPFKAAANARNPAAAPTEVAAAGAPGQAAGELPPNDSSGQIAQAAAPAAPPTPLTSDDLGQTPPWPQAVVTGTSSQPMPAVNGGAYAAAPPTQHQSAYYEQPAQGGGFPVAPAENVQQMAYSAAIANDDPFADVSGQPASSSPVQYPAPSTPAAPADWATPPVPTATAGTVPYEWGAPTGETASDDFLPPIRQ